MLEVSTHTWYKVGDVTTYLEYNGKYFIAGNEISKQDLQDHFERM